MTVKPLPPHVLEQLWVARAADRRVEELANTIEAARDAADAAWRRYGDLLGRLNQEVET